MSALQGREIVLVGGAGGLGSATAKLLAAESARVVISSRSHGIRADITEAADRKALLDSVPNLYGLVILAGIPARGEGEEVMRLSHQVNYEGPILLAREAAGRMKARGTAGAIVLFASMQAVALFPGLTAYAGEKAALLHSARILAKECRGPANIRVNVIAPGVMQAGMAQASIASGKYDRYLADGVIPRFGSAADVARAVRFLLEPDNYITGQVLSVDGGITL
ncbi:MAG TPA: SDR family oxidoreductase [Bryobacteraceae bacterium]|nr:SDR family oxidoreductase [Bryobacteraceae bacterium]